MLDVSVTALLERLRRGDPSALGPLYDATVSRVFGLALRITGNPADAEEVTNDVYEQLWRLAARFDLHRGNAFQWIMVIARTRALDHLRRGVHEGAPTVLSHAAGLIPDSTPTAEEIVQRFEVATLVRAAMSDLSALQIQLIGLAFFEGLSHQEVASRACLPLGTVKSQIRRALALLRVALGPQTTPARRVAPAEDRPAVHTRMK